MAGTAAAELKAESHLILDQTLLRMPLELSKKNLKAAQRHIERESKELLSSLKSATQQAAQNSSSDPSATLESIDAMIARLQNLKRKLTSLHEEEVKINKSAKARISHLQDLYTIPSLMDVKYDTWSRTRLARLLVDYLLRSGYVESAAHLAAEKGIEELVDVDAFRACLKIERCLRVEKRTAEALNWCAENKQGLKKLGSLLEFEIRLQQFIEMVREGYGGGDDGDGDVDMGGVSGGGWKRDDEKMKAAREYAMRWLSVSKDQKNVFKAAGLLAFPPWTDVEPFKSLYSPDRWTHLSTLFLKTHNSLYSLPARPLLHVALSAGLSALKTPSCHSPYASSTANSATSTTTVCPICSTELNELARNVPYAHHSKSIVENDPVVLPNGRIYGAERLREFNDMVGTEEGWVRDPMGGAGGMKWKMDQVRKVFIS